MYLNVTDYRVTFFPVQEFNLKAGMLIILNHLIRSRWNSNPILHW